MKSKTTIEIYSNKETINTDEIAEIIKKIGRFERRLPYRDEQTKLNVDGILIKLEILEE